jgi:endo-1,4-beta-D-glucanase Y
MGSLYFLPYSANYPSTGSNYKQKLADTWTKYKENFIDAYVTSHPGSYLVHDPMMSDVEATAGFDETEGASSEAQGYGLLLALYNNDQAYFDNILTAAYAKMHNKDGKGLFAAIVDKSGNVSSDVSSATDGDIFITLALVFADLLVKHGYWSDTSNAYGSKAQNLIDNIYANDVESGLYLMPGDGWTGKDAAKPSSFFTAALKTFKYYQTTLHNWDAVIDQCYTTLQSVKPGSFDGYFYGLSPDLCTRTGGISSYGAGGPSSNGYDMWYDAIRTPWMISLDAVWFKDTRAVEYCQNGMNFLKNIYGDETLAAQNAIHYAMNGTAYGSGDGAWHSEITTGMWSAGAMGSDFSTSKSAFDTEFIDNFSQNALMANGGYWGNWSGAGNYYSNQSLASFAALVMAGNFVNVYKDLVIAADTTPPSNPTVTDAGEYTNSLSQLNAAWSGAVDEESGITEYRYSISTDPTDPEVGKIIGWTSVGTNTNIAATGLTLTEGTTYYFHVKAINGAGLESIGHSDGITVDTSAPVLNVTDDGEYTASSSQLHVAWSASGEEESGIQEYLYAISTNLLDPEVGKIVDWTSAGTNTDITATGLTLTNGTTYYFHVKAIDGVGNESIGHSDGIKVDYSAPSAPGVTDDGATTTSLSQLHAAWSASVDEESGITEYLYAISTDPFDPETGKIVDWTSANTDIEATANGLSLTNGTTYYFHVKAINGTGLESVGHSDGITVDVDTTAPSDPIVNDDGIYTNYASKLHAAWSSSDDESGITEYQYAISTDPNDPDTGNIVPWTSAGTDAQATATGLSLTNGTAYYFHVKAKNGVGLWSNVGHSNGITVNNTAGSLYFLCYSANYPSTGSDYKDKIAGTWAKYKENFVDAYTTGLIHNPQMADDESTAGFDETEGATSEAQGYGLLLALYNSDQTYFDKILTAAYTKMHNKDGKGLFASKVDKYGDVSSDVSSATDGDIFITLALIFADTLIKQGCWSDTGNDYGIKAQNLINNIYANDVDAGLYLMPGDGWTGKDAANPSYFFTAALKTFKYYQSTFHNWDAVVDQCYTTLQSTQGYSNGLSPDLCARTGGISSYGTTGPSGNGYDMWYDGIRTPWMMALDAVWFNDPRAVQYCQNGMNFLTGRYGSEAAAAQSAIMYKMDGTPYTSDDGAFYNELTVGMFGAGAMVSGSPVYKAAFNTEFENGFSQHAALPDGYWGNWYDEGKYYYNQSMASFAALIMSGNFVNVYKDLVKAPDTTPPSDPAVTDDGAYTIITSQLHAVLSPSSDAESGIKEYQYAISTDPTDPEAGNIVAWTSVVPNTTEINENNLNLTNGKTYYFHVKAINGEGLVSNIVHSNGIKVDNSVPSKPEVVDDGTYATSPSGLHAKWSSSDDESGITEYWYAVSTDPNDPKIGDAENIVPWISAGTQTEITLSNLNLSDGKTYYFHIISKNGAGQLSEVAHSDGIKVDTTAPSIPVVNCALEESGSLSQLHATWSSSDDESHITGYKYAISTDPNNPNVGNVLPWTSAGTDTEVIIPNFKLAGGKAYYFHVMAINGAGLESVGRSDGINKIIVDTSAPSDPSVTVSGTYSASSSELEAVLSPSYDEESGITEYQYAISTDPKDPKIGEDGNVLSWTSVSPSTTKITATGLTLTDGTKYYFHVRAINGVGLKSNIVHSSGIIVDASAPSTPVIVDDGTYTTSTTELHAKWSCSDPQSFVTEFQYTISTDPNDANTGKIINWTSAGTNTEVNVTGLSLKEGTTYYIHVEAKNGAGLWSEIGHSDGIIVNMSKDLSASSCYPTPFRDNFTVRYELRNDCDVTMQIYNTIGRLVNTLKLGPKPAGIQEEALNGESMAAGVYYIQIQTGDKVHSTVKTLKIN